VFGVDGFPGAITKCGGEIPFLRRYDLFIRFIETFRLKNSS
jgi:hypothetical protein